MTKSFAIKWAVGSLTIAAFAATFAQGFTGNPNLHRCTMDKFDHSGRVPVELTVDPRSVLVQFDDGKPYVLARNDELSIDGSVVAAASGKDGSVSLIVDKDGALQMTVLTSGDDPLFAYGECER